MRLLMISAFILLSGCSHSPIQTPQAKPPSNALAKCESLESPAVGDNPDVYVLYLMDEYYGCAIRHNGLVSYHQ